MSNCKHPKKYQYVTATAIMCVGCNKKVRDLDLTEKHIAGLVLALRDKSQLSTLKPVYV